METRSALSQALDEAVQAALVRLLSNYGSPLDENAFAAQLASWRLAMADNAWVTPELVRQSLDWFLYRDSERERMPPVAAFLDACRRYREIEERRRQSAEPILPGPPAPYLPPSAAGDEQDVEIPVPRPNTVRVQWKDGTVSQVELTPPGPRYLSDDDRKGRIRDAQRAEARTPTWVGECSCGEEVYEIAGGKRFRLSDAAPHGCKWTTLNLNDQRELRRVK